MAGSDRQLARAALIVVDSNVFVIDLRYRRDALFEANRAFLDALHGRSDGATTAVNLLEVAGILSFNLNRQQLRELVVHLPARYGVSVLPTAAHDQPLSHASVAELLARMDLGMALGDALVIDAVERYASSDVVFVTWDARHFAGKCPFKVQTPAEFMAAGA